MATVTLANVSSVGSDGDAGREGRNLFSAEIPDNAFFVFLGPAGCGKTRILRIIAGLDLPAAGEILIGGKNMNGVPPKDRDIALVCSGDTLIPHLTARANVAAGLHGRKLNPAESGRRVDCAASLLKIETVMDLKPDALTAAQRIRVSIARAVARQPKVFLFDDPLSRLSAAGREQLRPELFTLHHQVRATIIHATSDPAEALALAGRIAVLEEGMPPTIAQTGSPLEIFNEPANRFVAGFAGVPQMNFLTGTLRKDGEQIVFKEAPGGTLEILLGSRPPAEAWIGKEITLGLRPEDFDILPAGKTPQENTFQVLADIVETLGADTHVHADTGAHKLLIRSRTAIAPADAGGHRIRIQINAGRAHIFDPASGRAIR